MYSIHNEGKSVVAERFIRTLKKKFTNILLQYQMYYFSIYWRKNNKENQEGFVVKKFKNTLPWTYVIDNLNSEEIVGAFYEKELQKKIRV